MPFLIRDLGFSNLVNLLFVLLATISAFVVRRKWRIAAARKEEIMGLLVLASEEAARAELEAAAEYGSVVVSTAARRQCPVCCCPTTTRCSRCNCSGKCQIIHWRQGHKEECSPPTCAVPLNDTGSDSDSTSVLHAKQSDIEHVSLGAEEDSHAKPIQESMRDLQHLNPVALLQCWMGRLMSKLGLLWLLQVLTLPMLHCQLSAAGGFTSTPPEELRASSVHENPLSSSSSILREPLSDEISHDNPRSKTDVVHNKTKSQTSKGPVPAVAAVDTFSYPSKMKQKTPSKSNETVDHESSSSSGSGFTSTDECSVIASSPAECPNATINSGGTRTADHDNFTRSSFRDGGDSAQSDSGLRFSNLSRQSAPSGLSTCSNPKTLVCDSSHFSSLADGMPRASPSGNIATEKPPTWGSEESSSITKARSGEKRLLKSSGAMPLSYGASSEHASSGARCSTSSATSPKVDTVRTVPLSYETIRCQMKQNFRF